MKRIAAIFLILIVGVIVFVNTNVKADFVPQLHGKAVDIYYNDLLVTNWGDALPFINTDGKTMIPLRFYSEMIGCRVEWFQREKKINITYIPTDYYGQPLANNYKIITLWVNNRKVSIFSSQENTNRTFWLDTVPWQEPTYPWRVYVPLRFVSSCLGDTVNWYPQGAVLPLFPDVTIKTDTVMLAHFLPPGPDDYQIVPGERWGKYSLNMPLEQFNNYFGHYDDIYLGSRDKRYGKYVYTYYTPNYVINISFVKGVGIVTLFLSPTTSGLNECQRYFFVSMNGLKYYYLNRYDINNFELDNPNYYYVFKDKDMRGGEEVEGRNYYYMGMEVYLIEDYQIPSRGWKIEVIWLNRKGWDDMIFFKTE